MELSSPSFGEGDRIPVNHTADGANLSPPLAWSGVPPAAKSLLLLVEDPDAPDPAAPQRTFVHWIVFNLDPSMRGLDLGASSGGLPPGARQGRNDFGAQRYGGPNPPVGQHRYFFRLFALDRRLPENAARLGRAGLLSAIEGAVIDEAVLVCVYERERSESHPLPS